VNCQSPSRFQHEEKLSETDIITNQILFCEVLIIMSNYEYVKLSKDGSIPSSGFLCTPVVPESYHRNAGLL
jgi:hypothetical protein